jgi:pectate lyase
VTPAAAGAAKPAAPASVTASQSAAGQVTLTWTPVPGATGYMIARSKSPTGFQRLCDLCPAATTYTDNDAEDPATYIYEVAAISPGGNSARARSNTLDLRGGPTGPKNRVLTIPAPKSTPAP